MLGIGVRHGRVLPHDIHATNIACMDFVHDLHHGQATFGVEFGVPKFLELFAGVFLGDELVIRIEHWNQPGIRSALYVVLAA